MIKIYALLTLLGIALPYGAFIPWVINHGVDLNLLLAQATANPISIFAWLDVVVSAVVLLLFIVTEGRKHKIKYWPIAVLGTLTVGVSCGLPLFLLLKERQSQQLATN